jgi:hypothetical protein
MNDEETVVEIDNGKLTYQPKTVIFEGKVYDAPINVFPLLVQRTLLKVLEERINGKNPNHTNI